MCNFQIMQNENLFLRSDFEYFSHTMSDEDGEIHWISQTIYVWDLKVRMNIIFTLIFTLWRE